MWRLVYPTLAFKLGLLRQIHVFYMVDGVSQKAGAEVLKLLRRIGSEIIDAGQATLELSCRKRSALEQPADSIGGGVSGIDDLHMFGSDFPQYRLNQWIVRAAEQQDIGGFEFVGERLFEINAGHLFGNRMIVPSLFD
jgi:hypothetical protein